MSEAGFTLDPRLAADTCPVASLSLCDVLLMNDARYPWLILVPRRPALVEASDLGSHEQALLWHEVGRAGAALRAVAPFDKLNLGALGNIVRQLHVHVVGRRDGDAAWPGPVWGNGRAEAYEATTCTTLINDLCQALARAE
jgi:diadenosine tetraphosphate (Ap4A) HIT family hydrolase